MAKLSYPVLTLTRTLASTAKAHRFIGTDNAVAGAGANTIGVSQMPGASGEDTAVDMLGAVAIETGAAVTAGGLVQSDALGRAINKGAGVGTARALEGATAEGEFILCQLIPN